MNGGHPDFFYLGANGNYCIPNASGSPATVTSDNRCSNTDSTEQCRGLVKNELGPDGKPQLNTTRTNGLKCACRFTDWYDPELFADAGPERCWDDGGVERKRVGFQTRLIVQSIKDQESFW